MKEMKGRFGLRATATAVLALLPAAAAALTRDIADMQSAQLTLGQSVVNQLSYDTYRDPFDELQSRPYNLLFQNIGRHSTLTPWQGQEGSYTKFCNALVGNNGAANVDNNADAVQGSLIRRETASFAWGFSAAAILGNGGSDDANGTSTFSDKDDLEGLDLRGGLSKQISDRRVLGGGFRVTQAGTEFSEDNFEPGVGGISDVEKFDQVGLILDFGMRTFLNESASWEFRVLAGYSNAQQDDLSDSLDGAGVVTSRFVTRNYDIQEMKVGATGSYNRLHVDGRGETEFGGGIERSQRELGNNDLAYTETGGTITPTLTLLGQDVMAANRIFGSAKTVFLAGETELFAGARLGYEWIEGATQRDNAGTIVTESIDDTQIHLAITAGLRQPIFTDKLRFIVSGRGDFVDSSTATTFDTGATGDSSMLSSAQYAIGFEGVLANVVFDLAWLAGEEAPVLPVALGLPSGSRRTVELDRFVFSAAVSW